MEKPAEDPLGNRPGGDQVASGSKPGERQHHDRAAVCRRAMQPVDPSYRLSDVGRTAGTTVAEEGEGGASEATECEDRECEEQLALLREKEERLGGEE